MDLGLTDKVALVTGSYRGTGGGIARSLANEGAIVLVTHDEGAVQALQPDRVLILPDGVEDLWNAEYADLVALA